MRTLKRVFRLAPASAMLLGMMVIGAGAADTVVTDTATGATQAPKYQTKVTP